VRNVFLEEDDEPDFLDELEATRSSEWVDRMLIRTSKWDVLVPDTAKKKISLPAKKIELRRKF
jgi:hypothetical protein